MLEVEIKKDMPDFNLAISFAVDHKPAAFLGPSGSGKSLTLQCIAGLLSPDSGTIIVNGRTLYDSERDVNLPARLRNTGVVFQHYALFPHLTVLENVAFGMIGLAKSEASRRAMLFIEKMKIKDLWSRYPHELSGGQQQRVALARALASQPDLLLLDEPYSALDAQVKEELQGELGEFGDYFRGSVMLITHDIEEAYRLCPRIIVINEGKVVQQGSRDEVLGCPKTLAAAKLTGLKNIIEGIVTQVEKDQVKVYAPQLGKEFSALSDFSFLEIGTPVILGIRSQHILVDSGAAENTVTANLARKVYGLKNIRYVFGIQGTKGSSYLEVELGQDSGMEVNQEYQLELPRENILILKN